MATVARNNLDIQIIQTQRGIIPDWGVASFVFWLSRVFNRVGMGDF
jgi:hypothetical protein